MKQYRTVWWLTSYIRSKFPGTCLTRRARRYAIFDRGAGLFRISVFKDALASCPEHRLFIWARGASQRWWHRPRSVVIVTLSFCKWTSVESCGSKGVIRKHLSKSFYNASLLAHYTVPSCQITVERAISQIDGPLWAWKGGRHFILSPTRNDRRRMQTE